MEPVKSELKVNNSRKKPAYGLYLIVLLVIFAALWFVVKNKSADQQGNPAAVDSTTVNRIPPDSLHH